MRALLLMAVLGLSGAWAAMSEPVTVPVKGLVCSFCANGLVKVFERRSEVAKLQVSLERKTLTIFFKDKTSLSAEQISEIVESAGYSVDTAAPR